MSNLQYSVAKILDPKAPVSLLSFRSPHQHQVSASTNSHSQHRDGHPHFQYTAGHFSVGSYPHSCSAGHCTSDGSEQSWSVPTILPQDMHVAHNTSYSSADHICDAIALLVESFVARPVVFCTTSLLSAPWWGALDFSHLQFQFHG